MAAETANPSSGYRDGITVAEQPLPLIKPAWLMSPAGNDAASPRARGFAMRLKIGSLKIKGRFNLLIGLMAFGCVLMTAAMIWLQERSVFTGRARELEALVDTA